MKNVFLLIFLIFFSHCSSDFEKKFIDEKKMADILVEIHLLEAKISLIKNIDKDSSQKIFNRYEKEIFDKYDINKPTFNNSFEYYSNFDLEGYEKIYGLITDSLNQIKSDIDPKEEIFQ